MTLNKTILCTAGCLLTVALAGIVTAPKVAAAIRATFVEVVIPSRPYNVTASFNSDAFKVFGPDTGTLAISTMTFTNFSPGLEQVAIFQAGVVGSDCSTGTVTSVNSPAMNFLVQANSTLVVPFTSPVVYNGVGGHTCIYASVAPSPSGGRSVEVDLTGFVN